METRDLAQAILTKIDEHDIDTNFDPTEEDLNTLVADIEEICSEVLSQ